MQKSFAGLIVALFAVLAIGVAVVHGQGASTPGASATPGACASPAAVAGSPTAMPAVASPAACASPVAGGGGSTVTLQDIFYNPKEVTITANSDGVIKLDNKGSIVHNFNIDALNIHSGDIQPGATGMVTINAKAGDYEYYCNIPGHKAAGMVGVLHVK